MARVDIKIFINIKQIPPKTCKYSVGLSLYIDISYIVKNRSELKTSIPKI